MITTQSSAIAVHVEAAKRLLRELDEHAQTALNAARRQNGAEFVAAAEERDRVLGQLDGVAEALAHASHTEPAVADETSHLFEEMAQAAAAALESHDRLSLEMRRERERMALVGRRPSNNTAADSYAAASHPEPRAHALSVTG